MSKFPRIQSQWRSLRWHVSGFILLMLLALPGCSGCRPAPEVDPKDESKKPVRPISYSEFRSLPAESTSKALYCKPGHVLQARQGLKANQEDLQCWIESAIRDSQNNPIPMPGTRWYTNYNRPAALPKGTTKNLDLRLLITPTRAGDPNSLANKPFVNLQVVERGVGSPIDQRAMPTVLMPNFQYQWVVLSDQALRFEFLRGMDCISWYADNMDFGDPTVHYRVVMVDAKNGDLQLPDQFVALTSTAYMLIDDIDPSALNVDQQQAMTDWLLWGGQIIFNGPAAYGKWQNSFLKSYMPIASANSTSLTAGQADDMNNRWTLPRRQSMIPNVIASGLEPLRLPGNREVPALVAPLSEIGSWVTGCENLIAESFVGRGRIAVTMFPMHDPMFVQWPSYSAFCNATILRRPSRVWVRNEELIEDSMVWGDDLRGFERDSRLVSNLRIFSRDASLRSSGSSSRTTPDANPKTESELYDTASPFDPEDSSQPTPSFQKGKTPYDSLLQWEENAVSGVGGWSDFSSVSVTALAAVRDSSGINVPKVSVIIQLLAGYLIILVPVNWLVFRIIGRLEWAWLAAPIIALIGVVVVTRVAQLDIGFARSQTEVGIMELQGDYQRAHLTRFVAMYSSLSTNYKIEMDPNNAMIQPCAGDERQIDNAGGEISGTQFVYGEGDKDQLSGFRVISNTTSLLHTEQMLDLGGGISLETDEASPTTRKWRLMNRSNINIKNSGLFRRREDGSVQIAWVGDCAAGKVAFVEFVDANSNLYWFSQWDTESEKSPESADEPSPGNSDEAQDTAADGNDIDLRALFRIAIRNLPLSAGQTRLIGEVRERQPGLDIFPASTSLTQKTLLVAHLTPAIPPPISVDIELRSRVAPAAAGSSELLDETEL